MAPNKDWYWDQFDVDVKDGQLDLSDAQTVGLEGLTDQQQVDIETDFIDELYGTQDRAWETHKGEALDEGGPTDDMYADNKTNQSFMTNSAEIGAMGSTYRGGDASEHVLWGLDLVRVYSEDLEVGTPEHYEWLTRGEVDWAHYENDNAFKRAFNTLKDDPKAWSSYGDPNGIDFLTSDDYTDQQKINFIRDVNGLDVKESETDDKWHIPDDFDNKYTSKYYHTGEKQGQPKDPQAVLPYEASPLFDPQSEAIQSRLVGADGKRMSVRTDIKAPSATGGPRNIGRLAWKAGINLKPVNVKRPSNIPSSWGSVTGGNT